MNLLKLHAAYRFIQLMCISLIIGTLLFYVYPYIYQAANVSPNVT
jgi:hypothetical protein